MYKSEKKSVINVLVLYLSSTLLLFATLFTSYYFYQKEEFLQAQKNDLKKDAVRLNDELISLHKGAYNRYKYPRFKKFESAIYDIDKELIFSTFQEKIEAFDKEFFIKGDFSYYVFELHPYYLGAAYAVIKKQNNEFSILNKLLIIALLTLIVILTTAYFLARLVLKPLRENIQLLDHFIKDTTHELNTPITTILTNIESIKIEDEKALKKLSRIQTAAMNISNLYEDLVYLVFNHKVSTHNETLDLSEIVQERIEYFSSTAQSKQIHFLSNIANNVTLFADKQKIKKLIDNILSNAIKYSDMQTTIALTLKANSLIIQDEGIGMTQEEIEKVFERYRRFDTTQGGFGIGYSIIDSIVKEYQLKLHIESKKDFGTKVSVSW